MTDAIDTPRYVDGMIAQPNFALNDPFLVARLKTIIAEHDIKVVVETGTNEGKSTVAFCDLVDRVIGVDNNPTCVAETDRRLREAGKTNAIVIPGSSPEVIKSIRNGLPADKTLWFLDAHWQDYWPIRDEIIAIPRARGVIVVHDMKVPGKNFGFDRYRGRDLDYDYLRGVLTLWSLSHRVEYSTEVAGSGVGAGFIFP